MVWSINTSDLACIGSFEAAEKHWNKQKAWRDEPIGHRPLAARRKKHMYMNKLSGGGYECVLYRTAIVTYYPDGNMKLMSYDSQSTQLFAWNMKPRGCQTASHKGKMFWKIGTVHGARYHHGTIALTPSKEDCRCWDVTHSDDMVEEWVLDHKKAAEVRKLIKPYGEWLTMTDRLMGKGRVIHDTYFAIRPYIAQLLADPHNSEMYPELANCLGQPERFRKIAYEVYGARTKEFVPYDRLPKEIA